MKTSSILPTAFLVTAMLGTGAAIATAQDQQTGPAPAETQAEAPSETRVHRAHERGKRDHSHRGRHGGGRMMQQIFAQVDADGDDTLTRAEIEAFRDARIAAADTTGDGALSLDEFETLYLAFMRDRVVDAFQDLDADGDASVTSAEIDARLDRIIDRMDRDGDGAIGPEDRRGRR